MTTGYSTFDLIQWMDADTFTAFSSVTRARKYRAGQIIYLEGDSGSEMFRLVKGWVRIFSNRSDGREIILMLYEPNDFFGGASLVDSDGRPHTAVALTDVEVQVLSCSSYRCLREQCRDFDSALLRLLAREIRFISTRYAHSSLSSLAARVANRILNAAPLFESKFSERTYLTFPLSQSELASMVGASRQSVNKVLQCFQSENLLRIEYGKLRILDLDGIRLRVNQLE